MFGVILCFDGSLVVACNGALAVVVVCCILLVIVGLLLLVSLLVNCFAQFGLVVVAFAFAWLVSCLGCVRCY